MQRRGKVWTVRDRYDDEVYLTWERWEHIIEFHDDMQDYFDELRETVRLGRRRQHPLDPYKYAYIHSFDNLPEDLDILTVVVLVKPKTGERFVLTAYMDSMGSERSKE